MKNSTIRRLTPIECERLQGFPDNWTKYGIDENGDIVEMSDSQRYKQTGNAVTTNVITAIAGQIASQVETDMNDILDQNSGIKTRIIAAYSCASGKK